MGPGKDCTGSTEPTKGNSVHTYNTEVEAEIIDNFLNN
jgi:hypothetical protein